MCLVQLELTDVRLSAKREDENMHREEVERVESFKFLGVHILANLTWSTHISPQVGKAQQRLYFLRKLKHAHLPQHLLTNFHRSMMESLLTDCCKVWFSSCTAQDRRDLQRVRGACYQDNTTPSQGHLHGSASREGKLYHQVPHSPWTLPVLPPAL